MARTEKVVTHEPSSLPRPTQAGIKGKTEEQEAKDQAAKGRAYSAPAVEAEKKTTTRKSIKK